MAKTETYVIIDHELGYIYVRENVQARRLIFRCRNGVLNCTTPPYCPTDEVRRAVDSMRERLRDMLARGLDRKAGTEFTPNTRIEIDGLVFSCHQGQGAPCVTDSGGNLTFRYPEDFDWHSIDRQLWLTIVVEEALRMRAEWVLLPRLEALAKARGLKFRRASISKAKGRWGSCSSLGDIRLSLYLMLLPAHLRDYIMQHELTHLVEMNHGPRFHALLDQAVGGRSQALRQEMKLYQASLLQPRIAPKG